MSPTRWTGLCLLIVAAPAPADPVDRVGDPLPPGAVSRIGTTRYRVRGWHQQAFLAPDGKTVVAKGENGLLVFFDSDTGKVLDTIKDPDLANWAGDESRDGKLLALAGADRLSKPFGLPVVKLYDLAARKVVWTARPADVQRGDQMRVRFAPDGKHVVTAGPDVRVWDTATGREVAREKIPVGYGGLDVSPDGKTIAVAYSTVHVWDWKDGAAPRKLDAGLRSSSDSVCFSPDGKSLYVTGVGGTAKVIDVASGKPAGPFAAESYARRVAFSPDRTRYAVEYFSTSNESTGRISIRDTATGAEVARLTAGPEPAGGGSWSRDGSRYAAVCDTRVWVWDVKTGKVLGPDVASHGGSITEIAFSPDGRLFTASDDHTVRGWEVATGKPLLTLPMTHWVRGLAVSADGSLVAGNGLRNDLRVWDAKTGKEVFKLHGHGPMGGLRRVRFSADDQRMVSFGDDSYLRTWDTRTGKLTGEYRFKPANPRAGLDDDDDRMEMMFAFRTVDLAPDGRTLALGTGKAVRVIDTETGKERYQFEAHASGLQQVVVSPDGQRLVTAGHDVIPPPPKVGVPMGPPPESDVIVWNLADAKPVVRFRVKGSMSGGLLAFTHDGRRVVTAIPDADALAVWDAATGAAVGTIALPARPAKVAFDGAGKRVAVAFWDSTALVYDLAAALKRN